MHNICWETWRWQLTHTCQPVWWSSRGSPRNNGIKCLHPHTDTRLGFVAVEVMKCQYLCKIIYPFKLNLQVHKSTNPSDGSEQFWKLMLASKEKMLCNCSLKQTQHVDDWILLHLTGKLPNKFTWFFHLPEHLLSEEPLINKTQNLWQTDRDWQIKHEGKHKNNYFDVIMLLKREGEGKYKRGGAVKEREGVGEKLVRVQHQSLRWEEAWKGKTTEVRRQGVVWWVHVSQVLGGLESEINCWKKGWKVNIDWHLAFTNGGP